MPAKYAALGLDVAALCAELAAKLPGNPNGWTLQGAAFYKAVAAFARGQYAAAFRPKAIEKVKTLSDGEVRERLLRLVEENPDVGLKILA